MKKILSAISLALITIVIALTFAGCDKSGNVKKAFENEGYTVTEMNAKESTALAGILSSDQKEKIDQYSVKGLQSATIVKFSSKDEIVDFLGEEGYNKAVEGGLVNGNCWLAIPVGIAVKDIFSKA
mgnify:CR=1 FL=1